MAHWNQKNFNEIFQRKQRNEKLKKRYNTQQNALE